MPSNSAAADWLPSQRCRANKSNGFSIAPRTIWCRACGLAPPRSAKYWSRLRKTHCSRDSPSGCAGLCDVARTGLGALRGADAPWRAEFAPDVVDLPADAVSLRVAKRFTRNSPENGSITRRPVNTSATAKEMFGLRFLLARARLNAKALARRRRRLHQCTQKTDCVPPIPAKNHRLHDAAPRNFPSG